MPALRAGDWSIMCQSTLCPTVYWKILPFLCRRGASSREDGVMSGTKVDIETIINEEIKADIPIKDKIKKLEEEIKNAPSPWNALTRWQLGYKHRMANLQRQWYDARKSDKQDDIPRNAIDIIDMIQKDDGICKVISKAQGKCKSDISMFKFCLFKDDMTLKEGFGKKLKKYFKGMWPCKGIEPSLLNNAVYKEKPKYYYIFIAFDRNGMVVVVGMTSFPKVAPLGYGDLFNKYNFLGNGSDGLLSFVFAAQDNKDKENDYEYTKKILEYYCCEGPKELLERELGEYYKGWEDDKKREFKYYATDAIIIPINAFGLEEIEAKKKARIVEQAIGEFLTSKEVPILNVFSHLNCTPECFKEKPEEWQRA
jgi:hypothetical protein